MTLSLWRPVLAAVIALAAPAAAAPSPAAPDFAPEVDYHQHLMSPRGAAWINMPRPAELPAAVAELIRRRAEAWNDETALAPLYAEQGRALDDFGYQWQVGRAKAGGFMARRFARPYRLTPFAFVADGDVARVAGYYSRGEGPAVRHFGHFYLEFVRGAGGRWLIATEASAFPDPKAEEPASAEQLIALLDSAGIRRAVVLSDAYWFDSPGKGPLPADVQAQVRSENDWTAAEVARFPDRLMFDDVCASLELLRALKAKLG